MGIIAFHPVEPAEGDVLRLAGMDAARAGARLETDLEEIAELVSRVSLAKATRELRIAAVTLSARATEVGLHRIARIARTIDTLARGDDATALAANVARLDRVGLATLNEIWRLQDVPG